jgi:3D (Asp-Asp-Asp) domain-containing protein
MKQATCSTIVAVLLLSAPCFGQETPVEEPSCSAPAGAACNPVRVDSFPFEHSFDTRQAAESLIGVYGCDPTADESGGEVHYDVVLAAPSRLTARVDEAEGVDVDIHLLLSGDPEDCLDRANTELEERLPAGVYRIVVDTYHEGHDRAGPYTLRLEVAAPAPEQLGTMWNTYYYLADESESEGPRDVPVYGPDCQEIDRVRAGFYDDLCVEGSGVTVDGRTLAYASTCTDSCPEAPACGDASHRVCFNQVDSGEFRWGRGARQTTLVPGRSVAVDPALVHLGTVLYLEELDGVVLPGETEPHDGCVRADDTGGAIRGSHFDFFAGTRERWQVWEGVRPTRSVYTVWVDHPRCYGWILWGWP